MILSQLLIARLSSVELCQSSLLMLVGGITKGRSLFDVRTASEAVQMQFSSRVTPGNQCRRLASTRRPEADSFANGPTSLASCWPGGPTT